MSWLVLWTSPFNSPPPTHTPGVETPVQLHPTTITLRKMEGFARGERLMDQLDLEGGKLWEVMEMLCRGWRCGSLNAC